MLVLSRKIGQSIVINDDITLTILDLQRGSIRIGFEAPKHIPIHRHEIWERIQQEKEND